MSDKEILVLDSEDAGKIYNSETKKEIIEAIQTDTIKSMRHLARRIERDKTNVRDALRELENMDVIELENGRSFGAGCKIPKLKHDKIIAKPILDETEKQSNNV